MQLPLFSPCVQNKGSLVLSQCALSIPLVTTYFLSSYDVLGTATKDKCPCYLLISLNSLPGGQKRKGGNGRIHKKTEENN